MAGLGFSFAPGATGGGKGPTRSPQEAVRVLNLRIPKRLGGSPIAPRSLLTSPGGSGVPGLNAVLAQLAQAFAPQHQPGVPTLPSMAPPPMSPMTQGGQIGHITRGTAPPSSPFASAPNPTVTPSPSGRFNLPGASTTPRSSSPGYQPWIPANTMRQMDGGDAPLSRPAAPLPRISFANRDPEGGLIPPGETLDGYLPPGWTGTPEAPIAPAPMADDQRGNWTPPDPVGPPPPQPGEVIVPATPPADETSLMDALADLLAQNPGSGPGAQFPWRKRGNMTDLFDLGAAPEEFAEPLF